MIDVALNEGILQHGVRYAEGPYLRKVSQIIWIYVPSFGIARKRGDDGIDTSWPVLCGV